MESLNKDILREIASYIVRPKYKMVDWIKPFFNECLLKDNENSMLWIYLSHNKLAHDFLFDNYPDKIYWLAISSNPNCVDKLLENIDNIDIENILLLPSLKVVNYFYKNLNNEYYTYFLSSPLAIPYIEEDVYKKSLFFNEHSTLTGMQNYRITQNINAYKIFEKYEDKILWNKFERFLGLYVFLENPDAYQFFLRHSEKFANDGHIFKNPLAIEYAKNNYNKIHFNFLSQNPNLADFMFKKVGDKYFLQHSFDILTVHRVLVNKSFIKFMINNTFFDGDVEYSGKEFILNYSIKKKNYAHLCENDEAINILTEYHINIFENPAIFELDNKKNYAEQDEFITNLFGS